MARGKNTKSSKNNSANLGFEAKVWLAADLHPDLRANFVLANPPFNPAPCGTNFAWVQHFIHHLAPQGMAGFVLVRFWFWIKLKAARVIKSSDSPTSVSFRERRRVPIEAVLADCMVALPGQLFYWMQLQRNHAAC
ncbi:MAG: type restriction enzyme protein [Verrucomicrobiota bacterium]|jgi:type I restriction enzyme M protein